MAMYYRRPGVYLEESLLINPTDVAGTVTVAAFVGAAEKGPINEPALITSWSDYVALYGGLNPIAQPALDPNNVSSNIFGAAHFDNLTTLQNDTTLGNYMYGGPAMAAGSFVLLDDQSKARYVIPAQASNRATTAPGNAFAADADITASDTANANKLATETPSPFVVVKGTSVAVTNKSLTTNVATLNVGTHTIPVGASVTVALSPADPVFDGTVTVTAVTSTTISYAKTNANVASASTGGTVTYAAAWTPQQKFWIGAYAFQWDGLKWIPAVTTGAVNSGTWVAGAVPGTAQPVTTLPKVLSYLPFAVYSYFQNGGRNAWVIRSAPLAPPQRGVNSSIAVNGSDSGQGNLTAFRLNARSPGSWGNTIKYNLATQATVGTGTTAADVFSLQILIRNSEGNDEVVESFPSLSVVGDLPGTRRADTVVNDSVAGSRYVYISNINENQPRPLSTNTGNAIALTGGIDPSIPDAGDLQDSALNITKVEGPISLNIVGYLADASAIDTAQYDDVWVGTTVASTLFTDREDIFIINDSAPPRLPGTSSSTYKSSIMSPLGQSTGDSYSASYGPWIVIPHPQRVGTTIAVPPGGAVMGMMARIDAVVGVFRAPAGVIATLSNAVGVQAKFTDTELGDLNASNINIIRSVIGSGICVMGGRTRKTYNADRYISARRTLIYIKEVLRRSTQFAVFENNDQRLWSALRMSAERILRPLWEAGGLRGSSAAEAYYITCDDTINTPSVIQSGEVRMEVGVALEYPAEFVVIRITQFDRGTFSNEVQPV